MIWQNAWAWLGLLSLALPVLIHLLSRRTSRRVPFPTLRFLDPTRLPPVRRTRIRDPLLLALRMLILFLAVAALAQPLLRTDARERNASGILAHAIIVDTSASTRRLTAAASSVRDSATRTAETLARDASSVALLETSDPEQALDGAAAWLRTQTGAREISILSDFQAGTIDSLAIAAVPADIGIRLHEIVPVMGADLLLERTAGTNRISSTIALDGFRTTVQWRNEGRATPPGDTIAQVIALRDGEAAAASWSAALESSVSPVVPDHVTLVHSSTQREQWVGNAGAIDDPGFASLLVHLARDPLARRANLSDAVGDSVREPPAPTFTPIGPPHRPFAWAARELDGERRLLLFPVDDPGTLGGTALIRSLLEASAHNTPVSELEPARIESGRLRSWERAPGRAALDETAVASDARWIWLGVLLLLAAESWLRSRNANASGGRQP